MEICPLRRIDQTLPKTHGFQAVQVSPVLPVVFAKRPLVLAHEAPLITTASLAAAISLVLLLDMTIPAKKFSNCDMYVERTQKEKKNDNLGL